MKIKDVMTTNPSYCMARDSSPLAARIMKEKDVGIVPVVKSETDRTVIGVVTDRDLCLAIVAENAQPDTVTVERCMTTNLVAARPDDDVEKALALMSENQIKRIPVVDPEGKLVGIVATADILQRADVSSDATCAAFRKVTAPTEDASKPRAKMKRKAA